MYSYLYCIWKTFETEFSSMCENFPAYVCECLLFHLNDNVNCKIFPVFPSSVLSYSVCCLVINVYDGLWVYSLNPIHCIAFSCYVYICLDISVTEPITTSSTTSSSSTGVGIAVGMTVTVLVVIAVILILIYVSLR